MPVRNVVFDVGNVIVPWDPHGIVKAAVGDERMGEAEFVSPLSGNPIWLAVNRGEHSLEEAKHLYMAQDGLTSGEVDAVYRELMASMVLIEETFVMMQELAAEGYRLFGITDNVHEIVAHLKERHDFWPMFEHVAVSAELGVLKPDPRMYQHVLEAGSLAAAECVFFDDVARNVEGAKAVGMEAFVFTDAAQARRDLATVGVLI